MVVEAREKRALRFGEMTLLPIQRTAVLHRTPGRAQVVLPGNKGRRLGLEGHRRVPYSQASRVEPGERPDGRDPLPQPGGERGPTPRRMEKISSHMRPTIGSDDRIILLGERLVGAVPVTHPYHVPEVLVELGTMGLRPLCSTARGHAVAPHRGGTGHPPLPPRPHRACQRCNNLPPRFVPMDQRLAHLTRTQRLHDRLTEGRDVPHPIGHGAVGAGHPLRRERRA
jgi:hypothetical protein